MSATNEYSKTAIETLPSSSIVLATTPGLGYKNSHPFFLFVFFQLFNFHIYTHTYTHIISMYYFIFLPKWYTHTHTHNLNVLFHVFTKYTRILSLRNDIYTYWRMHTHKSQSTISCLLRNIQDDYTSSLFSKEKNK